MVDPANGVDGILDVAIAADRIAAVEEGIDPGLAHQVYDAGSGLVTPGLIDLHVHGYNLVTPLGIDADYHCLGRGVTTAVDAGSAGSDTFPGFRAFAAERSRTRLLAFLNISRAGLSFAAAAGGFRVLPPAGRVCRERPVENLRIPRVEARVVRGR